MCGCLQCVALMAGCLRLPVTQNFQKKTFDPIKMNACMSVRWWWWRWREKTNIIVKQCVCCVWWPPRRRAALSSHRQPTPPNVTIVVEAFFFQHRHATVIACSHPLVASAAFFSPIYFHISYIYIYSSLLILLASPARISRMHCIVFIHCRRQGNK